MPDAPTLFDDPPVGQVRGHLDAEAALAARAEVLDAMADAHGPAVATILAALRELRRLLDDPDAEFTTDEVWAHLGDAGQAITEPRAMGVAMRAAGKAGLIHPTPTYRPSARPACHARPVRVWRWATPVLP